MIIATEIKDVLLICPVRRSDHRGFFSEVWNRRSLAERGVTLPDFVQDNQSVSHAVGTVRGLHYQAPPHEQGKLVRCGRGRIFDVAVDARAGSPSYGHWVGHELSAENGHQLWVPPGFLHGFMTLEPDSEVLYKCTAHYDPECDGAVRWDSCGIAWPPVAEVILSQKDATAPGFADFRSPFHYRGEA